MENSDINKEVIEDKSECDKNEIIENNENGKESACEMENTNISESANENTEVESNNISDDTKELESSPVLIKSVENINVSEGLSDENDIIRDKENGFKVICPIL